MEDMLDRIKSMELEEIKKELTFIRDMINTATQYSEDSLEHKYFRELSLECNRRGFDVSFKMQAVLTHKGESNDNNHKAEIR